MAPPPRSEAPDLRRIPLRRRLILLFGLAVAGLIVVVIVAQVFSPESGASEPAVAGIPCEDERLDFHIHAQLSIFVEGQSTDVPADIGVRDSCLYWLHTHDPSGLIHIEAPAPREFRLGEFFAIWGQPLSDTQLLDKIASADRGVRTSVNGQAVQGDPADVVLDDGDVIVLEYGPPFAGPVPGGES